MNRNQFDRIFTRMAQEFGRIERYDEDPFTQVFFAIESNAIRVHRKHPSSNSRRMLEALALALYDIKGRVDGTEYNTAAFRNENNERLEHAILMAVDPFTNEEAMEAIKSSDDMGQLIDLETPEGRHALYEAAVKCIIRLKDSVEMWIEMGGPDGYFAYVESELGPHVSGEDMNYALATPVQAHQLKQPEAIRRHRQRHTRRRM